jgi:hypothetical protein
MAFLWVGVAMIGGLVARRRLGVAASLGASVILATLSVLCPVSGHHAFGVWWLGQMAAALGLVALSVVAWTVTRRPAAG